ncbi:MAG: hypothetical protein LBB45_09735 [Methanobrevibacter sp.]|nr:hypothetical protein [Candidatus Methanovirga basalitermitum]
MVLIENKQYYPIKKIVNNLNIDVNIEYFDYNQSIFTINNENKVIYDNDVRFDNMDAVKDFIFENVFKLDLKHHEKSDKVLLSPDNRVSMINMEFSHCGSYESTLLTIASDIKFYIPNFRTKIKTIITGKTQPLNR